MPPSDKEGDNFPEWCALQVFEAHADAGMPLLVQFGSDQCALCPQATLDLHAAVKYYDFRWTYQDASSDLSQELEVAALPAVLVFHDKSRYVLYQKLRGCDLKKVIREHCSPRLKLDEDF